MIDLTDRGTRADGSPDAGDGGAHDDQLAGDFGRDGVSGMLTLDRALRARDVSRPGPEEEQLAQQVVDQLIARAEGRKHRGRR